MPSSRTACATGRFRVLRCRREGRCGAFLQGYGLRELGKPAAVDEHTLFAMVLARPRRQRVAILHKRSVELPSDIAGLIYIPFEERVDEATTL
jgi:hypothetical protein